MTELAAILAAIFCWPVRIGEIAHRACSTLFRTPESKFSGLSTIPFRAGRDWGLPRAGQFLLRGYESQSEPAGLPLWFDRIGSFDRFTPRGC